MEGQAFGCNSCTAPGHRLCTFFMFRLSCCNCNARPSFPWRGLFTILMPGLVLWDWEWLSNHVSSPFISKSQGLPIGAIRKPNYSQTILRLWCYLPWAYSCFFYYFHSLLILHCFYSPLQHYLFSSKLLYQVHFLNYLKNPAGGIKDFFSNTVRFSRKYCSELLIFLPSKS